MASQINHHSVFRREIKRVFLAEVQRYFESNLRFYLKNFVCSFARQFFITEWNGHIYCDEINEMMMRTSTFPRHPIT